MDFNLLVADLAQVPWVAPHLIEAVNEEDEEALLPLDVPLMHLLPPVDGPEFALPVQDQGLGAGLIENSQPDVNLPRDWGLWPEYEGLDYVGVQEEYEWSLDQPEEDLEDAIVVDNKASQQGPTAATKRPDPITDGDMLFQGISPSAPFIATIGLLPDSTPPAFGSTLEPVSHQQQVHPT